MVLQAQSLEFKIKSVRIRAYTIPTENHEANGTHEWDETTIILAEVQSENMTGLGFSYGDLGLAKVSEELKQFVEGQSAFDITMIWDQMMAAVRNWGRPGIASMAIAAIDTALWDLKAKLLNLPLAKLLGGVREGIMLYGSGGFTSYSKDYLQRQLESWMQEGFSRFKIKIGTKPDEDIERVRWAREAIGEKPELFVDANGAYTRKQAFAFAKAFSRLGVTWFEEPVSSDDLQGLRFMRDHAPEGMNIAAGEYGYDFFYFRRLLEAQAVDVLQADATRCAGITGFLKAGALCESFNIPLSAHTAPFLHLPVCCALKPVCHLEYFHDHARIEQLFFDGVTKPIEGMLYPDLNRPGLGLELKEQDVSQYQIYESR